MLEKSFDFATREADIGARWIKNNLFAADARESAAKMEKVLKQLTGG